MDLMRRIPVVLLQSLLSIGMASSAQRPIDAAHSIITIRVFKAGVFSALGHDHEIAAPVAGGFVDTAARSVEVRVHAPALRVHDAKVSDEDRTKIQTTMVGPEVLDAERYSEIVFRSKRAEAAGADSWTVHGDLTLHGQTHPVDVEVRETGGRYRGTARFRQTEFGIKPIKVAGGAVRVKDEIRVEFDIQLAR
jgi:polyisoprenoid-binding protein YceI